MQKLRRTFLPLVAALALALGLAACADSGAEPDGGDDLPSVTVYKSPTCGCCAKWVEHLQANGFEVKTTDLPNVMPMKERLDVPRHLASCHTAVVGGYVVEGHVPAEVIKRLLEEEPDVTGLAVPGMPMGSPGMEGAYTEPYDIIAFDKQGGQRVYAHRE